MAYVHNIPAEILSIFFLWSMPNSEDVNALSTIQSPLNVSHVCRTWRVVSLSTPRLWTQIKHHETFATRSLPSDRLSKSIARMKTWLHRSAGAPLDIDLEFDRVALCDDLKRCGLMEMLDNVVEHRNRWWSVRIWLSHLAEDFPLIAIIFEDVPLLEQIDLAESPLLFYSTAPCHLTHLRNFRLQDYRHSDISNTVIPILQNAPNLVYIHGQAWKLDPQCLRDIHHSTTQGITLQNLEVLEFTLGNYGSNTTAEVEKFKLLLECFALPRLRVLRLEVVDFDDSVYNWFPLVSLFERSRPRLTELYLDIGISDNDLLKIISPLAELRKLKIRSLQGITTRTVSALSLSPEVNNGSIVCPKLQSIGFLSDRLDIPALIEMIASRTENSLLDEERSLRTVELMNGTALGEVYKRFVPSAELGEDLVMTNFRKHMFQ